MPAGDSTTNILDKETLSELYRIMLKIRLAELKIAEIYPSDKIQSPVHLCVGQEAVSAGVCKALAADDVIYGTYRGHGLFIAKGGDMKKLFAELYAKDTGCARGKGGSMHLVARETGFMGSSAIVASTIPLATGHALAFKMRRESKVACAFFGDGAVDEGVFYESLNFALLKGLPVLYVLENNHYAVHSRVFDRHKQTELYRYAEGLGITGRRFDGDDVSTVYSSMVQAVREVRASGQPLLLEYMTYRWFEHVGPGQDHGEAYRDPEILKRALENDPVKKTRALLEQKHRIAETTLARWEAEIRRDIEAAVEFAEESPFPAPNRLYEDLYEERK
jgi:TPP-dependent pyruvate/acetoin dehydrogenase alpha subunit